MRKICYSVAASLDGFIAGPGGEFDWIVMDPQIDFRAIYARFDTLLMGRKTFEVAGASGGGSMGGIQRTIVVSRTLRPEDHPKITILADNVGERLAELRAEPGKDIWLFGGGSLAASLLALGMVDTVEVAVIPVLLGGGVPLVQPTADRARLRLVSSKVYKKTGTVSLEYAVENKRA
jgi:dihydrofolate reductase